MSYVDAMVCAVPTANREQYARHAAAAGKRFKQAGALAVVECWGDDVPEGELTSFPLAVQRRDDETVVFSWITWPSKEARDAAWQTLMSDPTMQPSEMPFDGKRLIYGGFAPILEL